MKRRAAPAKTLEGRETQLVALAIDLAEEQLRTGVASPSTINYYLKLGSTMGQLELEKLRKENQLLRAKTERLDAEAKNEVMYEQIIEALKSYSPTQGDVVDEEEL